MGEVPTIHGLIGEWEYVCVHRDQVVSYMQRGWELCGPSSDGKRVLLRYTVYVMCGCGKEAGHELYSADT